MSAELVSNPGALLPSAPASPAGRDAVLVVEDDDPIGELLRLVLSPVARRVIHVRTAAECLRWMAVDGAAAALVVMDCTLPDAHGGALAHRLRQSDPALPILLTSGHPQVEVLRRLAAEGPTGFLPKPFRPSEAVVRARELLAARLAA